MDDLITALIILLCVHTIARERRDRQAEAVQLRTLVLVQLLVNSLDRLAAAAITDNGKEDTSE